MEYKTFQDHFGVYEYINDMIVKYALIYLKYACKEDLDSLGSLMDNYAIICSGSTFIVKFYDADIKVELTKDMLSMNLSDYIDYCKNIWKEKERNFQLTKIKYSNETF